MIPELHIYSMYAYKFVVKHTDKNVEKYTLNFTAFICVVELLLLYTLKNHLKFL